MLVGQAKFRLKDSELWSIGYGSLNLLFKLFSALVQFRVETWPKCLNKSLDERPKQPLDKALMLHKLCWYFA